MMDLSIPYYEDNTLQQKFIDTQPYYADNSLY